MYRKKKGEVEKRRVSGEAVPSSWFFQRKEGRGREKEKGSSFGDSAEWRKIKEKETTPLPNWKEKKKRKYPTQIFLGVLRKKRWEGGGERKKS